MRENFITEIGVDNFEARLSDREIEVLASIRDWLETFPLRAGEKMWCIGVGGVANNKPFTGDIDIRIFLQLSDEPAPQSSAQYSAMYERFKDYILRQLQISPVSLNATITSPESEKSSPYFHPHIKIYAPPCKPYHLTVSTNTLQVIEDPTGRAKYLIRSDVVGIAKFWHLDRAELPPYSGINKTLFCVFVDRE